MQTTDRKAAAQFSQPIQQILTMLIIFGLACAGAYVAFPSLGPVFLTSPYLNGFIGVVFVIGVFACFWQVFALISSVSWIEGFAIDRPGHEFVTPPRLLSSLATLLRSRGSRMQITATAGRSILDSMAIRLDEGREITRYIINLLIFLGLLGTFFGLATTVPAVVETIRSLAPSEGESGADVFGRLMTGLEKQMGGMGTAFGSSLLGLAGSLVVGLLDLFTGHAQNRFYREQEEWLSSITRLGFAAGDIESEGVGLGGGSGASDYIFQNLADSLDGLQNLFIQSDESRTRTDEKIVTLTEAVMSMTHKLDKQPTAASDSGSSAEQLTALAQIADGQHKMTEGQAQSVEKMSELIASLKNQAEQGLLDRNSQLRLVNIDVQLLRINEDMLDSQRVSSEELRKQFANLNKTIRSLNRKPPQQPDQPPRRGKN